MFTFDCMQCVFLEWIPAHTQTLTHTHTDMSRKKLVKAKKEAAG